MALTNFNSMSNSFFSGKFISLMGKDVKNKWNRPVGQSDKGKKKLRKKFGCVHMRGKEYELLAMMMKERNNWLEGFGKMG